MYETKTTGVLELLMNVLSVPRSHGSSRARRARSVPRRREDAVQTVPLDRVMTGETYFEAARLTRWNR